MKLKKDNCDKYFLIDLIRIIVLFLSDDGIVDICIRLGGVGNRIIGVFVFKFYIV